MRVSIDLPEDVSHALEAQWGDLSRRSLEAVAIEGYRKRILSRSQVARMLGFETRMQVDAFMKLAGVPLDYTEADLERDREAHRSLSSRLP